MSRVTLATAALAALCAVAAGPEAWGKLIWSARLTTLALPLIGDEAARGAALYEIGRYAEADAAFAAIGRGATYDRGLTLAATGEYDLSVAYFDAVLFADRYDAEARHNRDVVASLVKPVIGEAMGHGRIETILSEAGIATAAFDPDDPTRPVQDAERDPFRASTKRPVTDARTIAADARWLDTLADAPGAYLKGRLAAEMARRRAAGEAHPEAPGRW